MALGLGNNLIKNGGAGNADKLSLDLQFAADKTLTARKGPTPTFIRASGDNGGTTYFGPSGINVAFSFDGNDYDEAVFQNTVFNGRFRWTSGDISLGYTGTAWALSYDGNNVATSAPTSAFRPDEANWSGTAAVVTATGAFGIVKAANNEPRFDHDPLTLACKGLLIEEQRINSITHSENMTVANGWSEDSNRILWVGDATTSPAGNTTAEKITELASSGVSRKLSVKTVPVVSGVTYAISVYAKASERSVFQLVAVAGFTAAYQNFDLSNGTLGSGTATSPAITAVGNGWYRCSIVAQATSTQSGSITVGMVPATTSGLFQIYQGIDNYGLFLWGAQLEAGSFPTSYIPTTTASVTRSADVCSITGSAFSGFYNQAEGSFACNYSIPAGFTGFRYAAAIEDAPAGQINAYTFRNTNNALNFINTGGYASTIGAITTGLSKHIIAYSGVSEFVYCKDGTIGSNTGSGTRDPSLLIRMGIGSLEGASAFTLNGHIARIQYFKKRLSNQKLQTLST